MPSSQPSNPTGNVRGIVVASACLLFAELLMIRWTGAELWRIALFKNLVIIAAFLGSGLGMMLGSLRPRLAWLTLPVLALCAAAIPLAGRAGQLRSLHFGGEDDFLWQLAPAATATDSLGFVVYVVTVFLLGLGLFIGFGALIGRELRGHPPLAAYVWNLLGSLIGSVAFALTCLTNTGPAVWLGVLALPLGWVLALGHPRQGRMRLVAIGGGLVAAAIAQGLSQDVTWSPYSRIAIEKWTEGEQHGYELSVNHAYFMTIADLSRPPVDAWYRRALRHYMAPYLFLRPERVLVLGSGGGNDVAAALRAGAAQVDAVEIDPEIVRFGRELHEENPYGSPRVTVHVDDARSFLQRTDRSFDLIVLGLLDSHAILGATPGVRLDNYVYTVEAMRAARARLRPGGILALSFAASDQQSRKSWMALKHHQLLTEAFGEPPLSFRIGYDFSILYLAGDGIHTAMAEQAAHTLADLRVDIDALAAELGAVETPTDDWPHLYLRDRAIPLSQLALVGILLIVSLVVTRVLAPGRGSIDLQFALLGAGFLLVETKGIADLGLLFGGTWWTISALFSAILVMALLSALFVMRWRPTRQGPYFAALWASLLLAYLVRPGALMTLSPLVAQVLGAGFVALPVFFSGVVFSIALERCRDINLALGSNLLGAVLGGFLEYSSFAWGIRALSLLACALYLLAALAGVGRSKGTAGTLNSGA